MKKLMGSYNMQNKCIIMECEKIYKDIYKELSIIDSVISTIQENCINLEFNSQYYESSNNTCFKLSEERNRYINLLTIAKERLKNIEELNTELENYVLITEVTKTDDTD